MGVNSNTSVTQINNRLSPPIKVKMVIKSGAGSIYVWDILFYQRAENSPKMTGVTSKGFRSPRQEAPIVQRWDDLSISKNS